MSKRVCKEDQIQLIMEYQFVEHIDDIVGYTEFRLC